MDKSKKLAVVNAVLFVVFCSQTVTGLMLLVTGTETASLFHICNAGLLLVLFIFHLVLNWGWVKTLLAIKPAK